MLFRSGILTFLYSTELTVGSLLSMCCFAGMYHFAPLSLPPAAVHAQASLSLLAMDGGVVDGGVLVRLGKMSLELDVLVHFVCRSAESLAVGMGEAVPVVCPSFGVEVYIECCVCT